MTDANSLPLPNSMYSKEEAAYMLSLSVRTVDNLTATTRLKPTRIGSHVMFAASELQKFVRKHHPIGSELS